MKLKQPFIMLVFGLTSCIYDPAEPSIRILNETKNDVLFELQFDTSEYKKHWSKHDFRVFLTYNYGHSFPGPQSQLSSFDTINLSQLYSIPPKSIFSIADGWGDKNNSVLYNRIKVIKNNDTIIYRDINSIKRSFKRVDKNVSMLVIQ